MEPGIDKLLVKPAKFFNKVHIDAPVQLEGSLMLLPLALAFGFVVSFVTYLMDTSNSLLLLAMAILLVSTIITWFAARKR